ncbi:MAG: pitrilysin family protein [Acidobacteria bacterium]|nr:pitrilysin family protein [Acidobacteriota bacterium]
MSGRVLVRLAIPVVLCLGLAPSAGAQGSAEIVAHPSELTYGPLDFELPDADGFRRELAGGVPAYLVPDRSLPLVDVTVRFRIGSWLEPAGQTGLASLTGELMRTGGAGELEAKAFDEAVEAVAGNFSAFIGSTSAGMSMNCLSTVLDECLDLFFSMLTEPRFDGDRLDLAKENELESLKQRNDDPVDVAGREGQWLLYGRDHVESRFVTGASLGAIRRDDLVAFHRRYVHPGHMVVAAAGDFDSDELAAKLSALLDRFETEGRDQAPWPPRAAAYDPAPGVYVAQQDIPQGRVHIGHRTFQRKDWGHPDHFALSMMDGVLGNGGFTTRLMKRIRSDEGLAYGAYSNFRIGSYWPSNLSITFQSKSETVAFAAKIALEEVDRIRTELVPEDELQTVKAAAIETFPSNFESAVAIASIFAQDEFLGRPHDYWRTYRANVEAVTPADVKRVAERHLLPDRLVMLIVGDWEEIEPGDADGRATMAEVAGKIGGGVTMLPERDPVSLETVGQ